MFSFFKSRQENDIFEERKRLAEVWKIVRRLVDSTAPGGRGEEEVRSQNRYNRCVPALVAPWSHEGAVDKQAAFGVTKDFSDNGVSLLLPYQPSGEQIACGFFVDSPVFMLGTVQRVLPFGGGYWLVGVKLNRVMCPSQVESLLHLAERLSPMVHA